MSGKKFRFSLESVLKLRTHETERARQELGRILMERSEQERLLEEARNHLGGVVLSRTTGRFGQRDLSRYEAYRHHAHRSVEEAVDRLEALRSREEEARLDLLKKKGAEEALRRIYEQEAQEHRRDRESAENAFLDEQAVSGFQRRRRAENR